MSSVYKHPRYYEIAFGFRDIAGEVDVLEECMRRYSRCPVKSVLELGCGNSPHMTELVGRGYEYHGLDLSRDMLQYSRDIARKAGVKANLMEGDMRDFSLGAIVDFAYVMLGSLIVGSTAELLSHLTSVARVLREGGLYFLDWCIQYETPFEAGGGDSWEMEDGGIRVKTTVSWKAIDRVEQTFFEELVFEVDDKGKEVSIAGRDIKRAIYPQEFLLLISSLAEFEFIGWWNNWDLQRPLGGDEKIDRPIVLIRRI